MRNVSLSLTLLLLGLLATPAAAQCPDIQHENWTGAGTTACPCFVSGEVFTAILDVPAAHYPIEIQEIHIGWGSVFGGAPQSLEQAIHLYPNGLPNPGVPQYTLPAPVLSDGFINVFPTPDLPGENRILNSGPFSVGLQIANTNAGDSFAPTAVHDGNGCQSGKNGIFAIPGGWLDACAAGVTGDWIISVVYQQVNCTGGMSLTVSNLTAGQVGTFDVTGGNPLAASYLAYSRSGAGSTNVPQLGVTLGLSTPIKQAGPTLFSNAAGAVQWNLPIPGNAAGLNVWLQVAQNGLISNVVPTTVQ